MNDHSMSIKHFDDYDIPCYCTYDTIYKYNLNQENSIQLIDDKIYNINDIKVLSFVVNHGQTECYGFIFKDKDSIKLFMTDFMSMNKNLSKFKFDEIFIECNYINDYWESKKNYNEKNEELINKYERQLNTHMELSNLVELLNSRLFNLENVNKINLIHISQDLGNNEIMKKTIEEEFGIECACLLPNGNEV